MRGLPHSIVGNRPATHRRPTLYDFVGINWQSPQAVGLVAWFPFWDQAGEQQTEVVRGQRSVVYGSASLSRFDPVFGAVTLGGGDNAGGGTIRTYRYANKSHHIVGNIVPTPWAYSFWLKTTRSTTIGNNEYLMQYTTDGGTYPGTAISLDTSGQIACNTNGSSMPDQGFKSTLNPFDQKWHHILFVQVPSGNANTADTTNYYYIDGAFDSSYGGCCQASVPAGDLFFQGDNQAGDAPSSQYMFDFRIYRGLKTLTDAKHLYNIGTRWDLYRTALVAIPSRISVTPSVALTGTAAASISEADIVTGGKTVILTLTGETWMPT